MRCVRSLFWRTVLRLAAEPYVVPSEHRSVVRRVALSTMPEEMHLSKCRPRTAGLALIRQVISGRLLSAQALRPQAPVCPLKPAVASQYLSTMSPFNYYGDHSVLCPFDRSSVYCLQEFLTTIRSHSKYNIARKYSYKNYGYYYTLMGVGYID